MKMIRSYEIEDVERKSLGLSFESLIAGAMSEKLEYQNKGDINNIQQLYYNAIKSEEQNILIDAIYYYRYIFELYERMLEKSKIDKQLLDIILKAMNNIAVICYDLSRNEEAMNWFNKILSIDPTNNLALDNMNLLKSENI